MSKYNFDEIIDRRGTNSLKWDVREGELPMWVADMDFATAPCIREAVERRASHGIFGYNIIPDEWYSAYQNWWISYHDTMIDRESLIFTTGVIPALSTAVRKFTTPAEKIIIQTPVYNIFFNSIINNGRRVLENPLVYRDGTYEMDFVDLEKKLSDPLTTMLILCNPHNPVGKLWDADTLGRLGELCKKHHVLVFSDEIHCDLTKPDCDYVPFMSVSETCRYNSITAIAPTKTFSIPGLATAAVVVPEDGLRERMDRALNTDEVAEPAAFAIDAAIAAFSKDGREWLDELRIYIEENKNEVYSFIDSQLPEVKAHRQDATYLLWLDMSHYTDDSERLQKFLREKTGLYMSSGDIYGGEGNHHLRLNVGCPRAYVTDGLSRLKKGLNMWEDAC